VGQGEFPLFLPLPVCNFRSSRFVPIPSEGSILPDLKKPSRAHFPILRPPPPSGKDYTDFDRVKFTIKTKTGKVVSVQADRCGGDVSYATVSDEGGAELFRHCMPDEEDEGNVSVLQAKYPGAMPYFFSQDPDYITVKERVARLCAVGDEATDIATIDIAIAALEVGEYLTTLMKERLSK
jgi:hypothetical protein